ncbi:hypothetical protein MJ588_14820 [Klebsiella pneumoniae]|nr:hypothetical protein MJ588_14820 [Klebsiella pneumoniae]
MNWCSAVSRCHITLFEKEAQAWGGCMPYSDYNTSEQMLANIASIEIPPIDL